MTCRAFDQDTMSSNHLPGGTDAKLSSLADGTRSSMMMRRSSAFALPSTACRQWSLRISAPMVSPSRIAVAESSLSTFRISIV